MSKKELAHSLQPRKEVVQFMPEAVKRPLGVRAASIDPNKSKESFTKYNHGKTTTMVYTDLDFRAKLKKPKKEDVERQALLA